MARHVGNGAPVRAAWGCNGAGPAGAGSRGGGSKLDFINLKFICSNYIISAIFLKIFEKIAKKKSNMRVLASGSIFFESGTVDLLGNF